MSLGDLIDLSGLITWSIGSLLTIKALHMTWNISKDNVLIQGDNNTVQIYKEMAETQRSFRLLWNFLAVLVAVTYPFVGTFYNSTLTAMALFGPILSVIAFITVVRGFGVQARFWDIFYIVGACISAWFIYCAAPYLITVGQNAQKLPQLFNIVLQHGTDVLQPSYFNFFQQELRTDLMGLVGFVLMFLSGGYLLFGFIKMRSFDEALQHFMIYAGVSFIGYFLVGGALININPRYWLMLFKNLFTPIF